MIKNLKNYIRHIHTLFKKYFMNEKKIVLTILDGWGLGKNKSADAIQNAHTPFVDSLFAKYPHTTLTTFGPLVGLPEGQMGNSEVGHLNIGAGRIVYQELQRIHVAIAQKELETNPVLQKAMTYAKQNNKTFHLLGLVSDGGVHAHIDHLLYLLDTLHHAGVKNVVVHVITDGRDTDPKSGLQFVGRVQEKVTALNYVIGSVSGRYYAMDRDKRWERVALAYNCLVHQQGEYADSALEAIEKNYANNITDEFILPTVIKNTTTNTTIQEEDVLFCFNFRTDRCREISEVLTQKAMPEFKMQALNLHFVTMTEYDKNFKNVHVVFETDNLKNTLGEVLEAHHKKQIRAAETEKYPHVTFFFNGGRETPFQGEERIMIPSPKVATYDLQPEMSAKEITAAVLPHLEKQDADFICINYANADMVGHTGVFSAAVQAVETVDACLQQLVAAGLKNNYTFIIIADHGNADVMTNEDGSPNTAHTTNLVPLIVVDQNEKYLLEQGKLGDLAPSILHLMSIPIPKEMTGNIVIRK